MADKIERVPAPWAKVHDQSLRTLLRAEIAALASLRTAARSVHAGAIAELARAKSHVEALTTVHHARPMLARSVGAATLDARSMARAAAVTRLARELATLRSQVGALDITTPDPSAAKSAASRRAAETAAALFVLLRSSNKDDMQITPGDAAEDRVIAASLGESYATAWAAAMVSTILAWSRARREGEQTSLAATSASTLERNDHRLRRIAATETARAYNDEHDEALRALVAPTDETMRLETERVGIMSGLFNRWDATLDRRTCRVCRDHDGEVVPIGMPFRAGDRPGDVHVFCRCIETLIFLPGRIGQA